MKPKVEYWIDINELKKVDDLYVLKEEADAFITRSKAFQSELVEINLGQGSILVSRDDFLKSVSEYNEDYFKKLASERLRKELEKNKMLKAQVNNLKKELKNKKRRQEND